MEHIIEIHWLYLWQLYLAADPILLFYVLKSDIY